MGRVLRIRCASLLVTVACALSAGAGIGLAASVQGGAAPQQPRRPQPLDPLTAAERTTAEKMARADSRVRELLGEGGRVGYLEFIALKSDREDQEMTARHAEISFLRQDAAYGVRAIVRVSPDPAVISVDKVPEQDVPMTAVDLDAARKLALASPELRSFADTRLDKATVEGLRVVSTDESDPCYGRRCIRLLFKIGNDYLSEPIVVVNLTTNAVSVQRRRQ
jgi:hypothetical protein